MTILSDHFRNLRNPKTRAIAFFKDLPACHNIQFARISSFYLLLLVVFLPYSATVNAQQQSFQLFCIAGGGSTVERRDTNEYGHEILVNFQKPDGNVGSRGLRPGQCTWPDRALRGQELTSRLYFQLDGRAVVNTIYRMDSRNQFAFTSVSNLFRHRQDFREERAIYKELLQLSTSSFDNGPVGDNPYSVCVKAGSVSNFRWPNQGIGQINVLTVSRIWQTHVIRDCP